MPAPNDIDLMTAAAFSVVDLDTVWYSDLCFFTDTHREILFLLAVVSSQVKGQSKPMNS